MAQRLNKKLVAGLTVAGMFITLAAAIVVVMTLPQQDPEPAAKEAEKALAQDPPDYTQARQWYERAYRYARAGGQDTPESLDYLVKIGDMSLAEGNARKALGAWRNALTSNPQFETPQQKIVEFMLELARMRSVPWTSVQKEAETLLGINANNYVGMNALGLALINQPAETDNLANGQKQLEAAFNGDKSNSEFANALALHYFKQEHPDKAEAVFEELMANLPADNPAAQSKAWRLRGQYELIRTVTSQQRLLRDKSLLPSQVADFKKVVPEADQKALAYFQKALEIRGNDADNLIAIGEYWTLQNADTTRPEADRNNAFAKAEDYFKQAILNDKDGYQAYLRLARLHLSQLELDKALQVLTARQERGLQREGYLGTRNKYLMGNIRDEVFRVCMIKAQRILSQEGGNESPEFKEIIDRLDKTYKEQAADMREEEPGVLFMKGRLEMLRGNRITAIKAFEQADTMLTAPLPEMKQYMAQLYMQIGEYGPAQDALQAILQAFPGNANAWAMFASLQLRINQEENALRAAQRAIEIEPDNKTALVVLANVYEKQKNWDKVKEIQQQLNQQQTDTTRDKLQRAAIYRVQAQGGESENKEMLAQAEKLLREVLQEDPLNLLALRQIALLLSQDPDRGAELGAFLDEQLKIAQQKITETAAATQPSQEQRNAYEQTLALLERLKVFANTQASREEKIQQLEELIKRGEDPFVVATELYQLYARLPEREDDAMTQLLKAHELQPKQAGIVETIFTRALRRQDWKMADEFAEKAIALGLDRSGGHFYRGRVLLSKGETVDDFQEAEKAFRSGLKEFPTYSEGHVYLARALAQQSRYTDAERAFREALRLNPRSGAAALGLASLAARRGDEEQKTLYLRVCEKLIPNHPWVRSELQILEDQRDPVQGIARREQIRKAEPKNINNLLRLADLYDQEKQYDQAEAVYREARDVEPKNLRVIQQYARFLRAKEPPDFKGAVALLNELVASLSNDETLEKATAQLLLATHMESMARQGGPDAPSLEQVDAAYVAGADISDQPAVRMDIGAYFLKNQRFDKAEEWFRKALAAAEAKDSASDIKEARKYIIDSIVQSRNPQRDEDLQKEIETFRAQSDDPFIFLAESEYHANAGRLNKALESINKYIELQPDNAIGHFRRGDINFQRSMWQAALEDYRTAKSIEPKGFAYEHRLRMALCLERMDQDELALAELLNILKDEPAQPEATQQLFKLYMRLRRWKPAEELIMARREAEPNSPRWPLMLVDLYRASEDPNQAIRYAQETVTKSQFTNEMIDVLLQTYLRFARYDDLIKYVKQNLPPEKQNRPLAMVPLAAAYASKGDQVNALQTYNRVLDMMDNLLETFANIAADLKNRLGAPTAMEAMEQRLARRPDERGAKFVLGALKKDSGDRSVYLNTIEELLAGIPADDKEKVGEKLYLMRCKAIELFQQGNYDKARKSYEEILEINPYHVVALNNLAFLLIDQFNDPKAALPYSRMAAQIMPQDVNVLDTVGWNMILVGNYDPGIAALRRAIGINDGVPAVHYHVAEALYLRSQSETGSKDTDLREATTECRRAHELIMTAGRDQEGVFDKILVLGEKLGLTLDRNLPSR